jgi:hypothetical protein
MKNPVYRFLVECLVMVAFLAWPVHANPIEITLVNYTVYQDNQPINGPITFSMKCYGTYYEGYFKARNLPINRTAITNSELIYSYSLTCEPGNCYKEDVHGVTSGMIFSSCDLEGICKGKPFFVNNFTTNPEPTCVGTAGLTLGGYGEKTITQYYAVSDEDRIFCDSRHSDDIRNKCDKYLKSDRPTNDGLLFSHEWRNNTWYYGTEDFIQCSKRINSAQRLCYENHSLANLSIVLKARPSLYCEKRFDIPSDNQTLQEATRPTRNTYIPKSPVESLYCRILSLFGSRC